MRNDGLLTPANAQSVWQARVDEIAGAINGEAARWGDNRTPDKDGNTWATNVQYTTDHFFFANGPYQSRTDTMIDIFNRTSGSGVGKIDWLVNLDAPNFNQYGGDISTPFNLTLANANGSGTIYYTLDGTDPRDAGGGLSSSAIAYSGTISLTDSTRVRARIRDTAQSGTANDWSAEVDKTFNKEQPLSLRIVELMYNPAGSGESEYIELLNIGASTIDLAGVQLADFSAGGFTFASGTLAPGERIVVAQDVAAFQAEYPTVTNLAPTAYSGSLSNGGEVVTLKDAFGVVLQSFTYGDSTATDWPDSPDGEGPSLEYTGPLDGLEDPLGPSDPFENPLNWRASPQPFGSPGTDGSVTPLAGDYDGSGTVDPLDYAKWKTDFGMTVAPGSGADGNSNGLVDAADYTVWRNNLGATNAGSGGGSFASAATPNVDVEVSPEPFVFVLDLSSATQQSDGAATVEVRPVGNAATGTDRNLILWQLLGQPASESHVEAPLVGLASSDRAAEILDPATLWEDDAWLATLGPGV
jgi:hypothetical protein